MAEEIERTPLPEGFKLRKKEESDRPPLPEGFKLRKKEEISSRPKEIKDVVGEELHALGVEDENELERAAELGTAEATRGAISGLTFGLSKNIPGLKPGENIAAMTGDITGELIPYSGLIKVFKGPAMKLAAKSPIFQRQIGSFAHMLGVGATGEAIHQIFQGEIPSAEDVLEHGVEWALLDAALSTLGFSGRFIKGLFRRSKNTGIPRKDLINQINKEITESGVDMTKPEAVSAKAMEILERPLTEAEELAASRKLELPVEKTSEVSEAAQEILGQEIKIEPIDLKTRKITDEPVNRLNKQITVLSEPYQPEGMNFTKEAESLEKNSIQTEIESVGTKAISEEELGESVKQDIETQLKSRKEEYKPFYETAEKAAKQGTHIPQETGREAVRKLKNISRLTTKPVGYNSVIKNLEDVLSDTGFKIIKDKNGVIQSIKSTKKVPISDTIELGRRLNEIIDFEAIEPTVKDALRIVVRAVKQDIREALKLNPEALTAFELAEEAHARTARKFSKDSIRKIRGQGAGEKISKMAESPSTLGDLKEVLSSEQMSQVEREILDKLNSMNYDRAKKQLREIEKHLTKENQKLAKKIVESKNPHNSVARKRLTQDAILDDLSNAFTNGTRPKKTLDLWKTKKGQKLVKETFKDSPNWPEVKSYLEKQSFNDLLSSVMKDGKIDLKKFNLFIQDPSAINNIKMAGGEEAVGFFRNLDSQVKQLENNMNLLEKFPKESDISRGKELLRRTKEIAKEKPKISKIGEEAIETDVRLRKETTKERGRGILKRMGEKDFPVQAKLKKWSDWFRDTMGMNEKGMLSVFGLMKLGLPNTVATLIGYKLFKKLLVSPRVRKAFLEASKHQTNPLNFILAIEELGKLLDEEE